MVRWPKSKRVQMTIAMVVAFLVAVGVFLQIAMTSFHNFYFGPHKAYPYPYPDANTAQMALYRDCGLAMLGAFVVVFTIQRVFTAPRK
jgi:hypothetical protein